MQSSANVSNDPLEAAAGQMRSLCSDGESLPPVLSRGSLGRMLIHIDNIRRSVVASTSDHVNAAKRLNDFAILFARVARSSDAPDGPLAGRLISVSNNLRAASDQLSRVDAIPDWRTAERGTG